MTAAATTAAVADIGLFEALAKEMNSDPERFERSGDMSIELALVMRQPAKKAFAVLLSFEGIRCTRVRALDPSSTGDADCYLAGDLLDWEAMFDDIVNHGGATGRWTINSLTMMGDKIGVFGEDTMGVDRFFRFNQSLQEFFDGAAHVLSTRVA